MKFTIFIKRKTRNKIKNVKTKQEQKIFIFTKTRKNNIKEKFIKWMNYLIKSLYIFNFSSSYLIIVLYLFDEIHFSASTHLINFFWFLYTHKNI